MEAKRPRSVTWLAVGVLMLTGLQMLRLYGTVADWDFLNSLTPSVSPIYFGLSGFVWSLAGLVLVRGLWRGKPWARRATIYSAATFTVYYWIDQLLLMIDPLRKTSYPFAIGMTLVLLTTIFWTLSRVRARIFFGELHE